MPSLTDLKAAAERWRTNDYYHKVPNEDGDVQTLFYSVKCDEDCEALADFAAAILSLAEKPVTREVVAEVLGKPTVDRHVTAEWQHKGDWVTFHPNGSWVNIDCDSGSCDDAVKNIETLADLAAFLWLTRWPGGVEKLMEVCDGR